MNKMLSEKFVTMNKKGETLAAILDYVNANSDMTICKSDDGVLISIRHYSDNGYVGVAEFFKTEGYSVREHNKIEHLLLKFAKINRAKIIDELFKD